MQREQVRVEREPITDAAYAEDAQVSEELRSEQIEASQER